MIIFFKIGKYVIKSFFLLFLAFLSILILFLYKPSYFLNNIENYFSKSLENYFLDVSVSIDKIEGNFYSGFTINNIHIKNDSSSFILLESISIKPDLKDIFYGKLVFHSIKINDCEINDINKIHLNGNLDITNNFLIPRIIIDDIFINNGIIKYHNNNLIFSGSMGGNISPDESNLYIKGLNLTLNQQDIYYLSAGSVNFNKGNFLFDNIVLLDKNNIKSKFFIDFNLVPFRINKTDISLNGLDVSINQEVLLSSINILSNNNNNRLNYNMIINLILDSKEEYSLIVNGNYENNILSFNMDNERIFDDTFSIDGLYDVPEKEGIVSLTSHNDNVLNLNGDIDFKILDDLTCYSNVLFNNSSYKNLDFNKISGHLIYKDLAITSSNLDIQISDNVNIITNNLVFKSLNDFMVSGNYKATKTELNLFNQYLGINFENFSITNSLLTYDYIKNSSINNLSFKGHSESISTEQINLSNVNYDFLYNDGKISKYMVTADDLNFHNYSFKEINVNYFKDSLAIQSNNINSGEFFNLDLAIFPDNIFINRLNGKINNTNISSEEILIIKNKDKYKSSDIILFIDEGYCDIDINFEDFNSYSINFLLNNIDLDKIDKLMFLNNRYNGIINGEFYISDKKNDNLFILTDLSIINSKVDNFEYQNMIFKASLKNNVILVSSFVGINDYSSFNMSGTIKINQIDSALLSPSDKINFSGYLSDINISPLNRYIPWRAEIGGNITSPISITGTLGNLNIDIEPIIRNPKFDKIEAKEISGKVSYKNNRIYFSDIFGETDFGTYRLNGSTPANFDYFNTKNITSNPIYIDINGKSTSMELLTPYFSFIKDLDGNFEYTLNIHGNYNKPIRDGEMIIKDANLNILHLDNSFDNINSYAVINNNRLIINKFSAELSSDEIGSSILINDFATSVKDVFNYKDGMNQNLNLSGSINLESFFNPDLSINIHGDNNYLSSSYGQFEGFADLDITITGRDTILISGEFKPKFNQFTVFDIENRKKTQESGVITNNKFIAYDIYLPFSNGITIKSDNINLFLEGEMNLTSFSNNDISLSGKANIIDGSFFYNGNEFYNTHGNILIDPVIATPYIELYSTTDIYEDNINVSFIGYTDNPNLILESTISNYSQSDILQLLTFQDKNIDKSITMPFGNIVSNYLETQLEKNVTLYTDLDEFRIQHSGSLMKGFNDADINVLLGKRISNKLYLNTKINLNDRSLNEYEMSYRLNNNTSIVAKIDDNKYWQLNYRFKYRY